MKMFFFCRNDNEEGKRDGSCGDRLMLNGQVASRGKRSIGNVGNGSDNVQRGSKLDRILR